MLSDLRAILDDPKKKRLAIVAGVAAIGVGALVLVTGGDTAKPQFKSKQDTVRHILTDKNTRDLSLDSLSAEMHLITRNNEMMRRELDRIKTSQDRRNTASETESGRETERLQADLQELRAGLEKLRSENLVLQRNLQHSEKPITSASEDGSNNFRIDKNPLEQPISAENAFAHTPPPVKASEKAAATATRRIVITTGEVPAEAEKQDIADAPLFIPAGSIVTGVFINGIDAPTNQGARRDPFPSTLRVQKEAILPNRFSADVRECFMLVSGYGDLSSERAYLRAETLSCIREDGGVIESRLDAYVVGEDGKAGVRGRLVSKQGQIIAKSLMAGFLGGVSKAFDVNPVQSLNIMPGNNRQYESVMSGQMMQGAAMKGASSALDRIAQFYLDMAEGIFPVLEVDAGRRVDIILTRGVSLNIRS